MSHHHHGHPTPDRHGRLMFWALMAIIVLMLAAVASLPRRHHVDRPMVHVATEAPVPEVVPPVILEPRVEYNEPTETVPETPAQTETPLEVIVDKARHGIIKVFRPRIPFPHYHHPRQAAQPAAPAPYAPDDYEPPHNQWGQL